jgi:hypothetical protein
MTAPTTSQPTETEPAWRPMPLPAGWVLEGAPAPRGYVALPSAPGRPAAGVWECGAGRFAYRFERDETVYVLEGAVRVTDEAGHERALGPGDFAHFPRGASSVWSVAERLRKVFVLGPTAEGGAR